MASQKEYQTAMINRSIRTIKAELEFLTDAAIITPQTLSHILTQIPPQTALHAPLSVGAVPTANPAPGAPPPPTNGLAGLSLNGNSNAPPPWSQQPNDRYNAQPTPSPQPSPAPPLPAYNQPLPPPSMPPLCTAVALYAYKGEDSGDLTLEVHDRIDVIEYMNAEWWKGRSSRTGSEGIFPRSYVRVDESKGVSSVASNGNGNNYGNAPLEVSGMGNGNGQVPGKGEEMGKKFGKKLGNAAIFGAGASIGGKIVNGIF